MSVGEEDGGKGVDCCVEGGVLADVLGNVGGPGDVDAEFVQAEPFRECF